MAQGSRPRVAAPASSVYADDVSLTPLLAFLEGPELIIILVILLVLFGGAKLPQLARSVGSAQREFKKGLSGDEESAKSADADAGKSTQAQENTSASDSDKS